MDLIDNTRPAEILCRGVDMNWEGQCSPLLPVPSPSADGCAEPMADNSLRWPRPVLPEAGRTEPAL